jgi:hypothetical protein
VRLARAAAALFEGTDALIDHGECLLDLAEVLRAAGDHDEAVEAARERLPSTSRRRTSSRRVGRRDFLAELKR